MGVLFKKKSGYVYENTEQRKTLNSQITVTLYIVKKLREIFNMIHLRVYMYVYVCVCVLA